MPTQKYKNDIKAAIHQIASGVRGAGMIDKQTMREFDASCLSPVHAFSGKEIKALREREDVSQSVFASYLNVTKDSVSKWERGEKNPLVRRSNFFRWLNGKGWQRLLDIIIAPTASAASAF